MQAPAPERRGAFFAFADGYFPADDTGNGCNARRISAYGLDSSKRGTT